MFYVGVGPYEIGFIFSQIPLDVFSKFRYFSIKMFLYLVFFLY